MSTTTTPTHVESDRQLDPGSHRNSATPTVAEDQETKLEHNQESHAASDPSVLIVDWDGPDDPQNPKK